jgi:phosphohistidine phosphatase
MDLILWRHADAEDGVDDMARELTAKGRKQALAMGGWLEARLSRETRILVSPARRALQTAAGLGRKFETVAAIQPGAGPADVLRSAGWPDADGTVLVVGHQPTLGSVAAMLLFGEARPLALKKGGLVWLTGRSRGGDAQVVLTAALSPELV